MKSLFYLISFFIVSLISAQIAPKVETREQKTINNSQKVDFEITDILSEDGCEIIDLKNSRPTIFDINKIHFASEEVAYAAGGDGSILKSTDSGETWFFLADIGFNDLEDLYFIDELNGYVKSQQGIHRTSDGGETWTNIGLNINSSGDIVFLNDTLGFFSDNEMIYRTINNEDWGAIEKFDNSIQHIKVFNETELIVNTHTNIYHSTDNGESWDVLYEDPSAQLDEIEFISLNTWYTTSPYLSSIDGVAFITTNSGGTSWDTTKLDVFRSYQPGFYFLNENVGFVYGGDEFVDEPLANAPYSVLKTIDGGETWTETNATTTWNRWDNDMTFTNESTGFLVGRFGSIQKTTDGGDNWTSVTTNNTQFLLDVSYNGSIGLVGGEGGAIFKTTDRGLTWDKKDSNTESWVQEFFWTSDAVYAVSSIWSTTSSDVIKSSDGGETWSVIATLPTNLRTIHFYDDMNGIVAGPLGNYYETADGGENWSPSTFLGNPNILTSSFPSTTVGYMAGEQNLVKTINGGDSWSSVNNTDFGEVFTMQFVDEQIGFLGGNFGQIYKTTDGGVTFDTLELASNPDIFGIHFFDEQRGYITTSFDVQYTLDGGQSWIRIDLPTNSEVRDMFFHEEQRATVIGRGGAIFDLLIGEPTVELSIDGDAVWCLESSTQTLSLGEFQYIDNYDINWSLSNGGQLEQNGTSASIEWSEVGLHTISVVPSNSCGQGPTVTFDVEVLAVPESASIMHESLEINDVIYWCIDDGAQSLSIANADYQENLNYEWIVEGENTIDVSDNIASIQWSSIGTFELSLTVSNQCGSSETSSVNVVVTDDEGTPTLTLDEEVLTVGGVEGAVIWFIDDLPIEGVSSQSFEPQENGVYKASITNGCNVFTTNEIVIDFVLSIEPSNPFTIYPNPSADIITIGGVREDDQIEILDLMGKIYEPTKEFENGQLKINVTDFSPGIYVFQITHNNTIKRQTIRIE